MVSHSDGFNREQEGVFVTLQTSKKLYSHWNVIIPSQWSKTDKASSDWRVQFMKHDTVYIQVSNKYLYKPQSLNR